LILRLTRWDEAVLGKRLDRRGDLWDSLWCSVIS
jgi:hypothetical protein